jgi:hypothetical protein
MRVPTRRPLFLVAVLLALAAFASPGRAAFHLWSLTEVYSNSSGSLQFIEMRDDFGGQQFISGLEIVSTNASGTLSNTFTIPVVNLPNSFHHHLLFGTAGIQAAGGPAPDFILPANFLFAGGGDISFFGLNSGSHPALPINGVLSYNWVNGTTGVNSPTNFAGQTGSIPAPASAAVATAGFWLTTRRRRTHPR